MTQFQKGQEVEVKKFGPTHFVKTWQKAKIIAIGGGIQSRLKPGDCEVEFADGSRWVFDDGDVRAVAGASK